MSQLIENNWRLLLPVVLGFAGIYFLLPQVRRSKPALGAFFVGVALILGSLYSVRLEAVLAEKVLFYSFSGIALIGGVMLISHKNPVHAALSFALVVLSSCGLFLLQGAPFLMAATVIIYAGAIVVTFLFVIMLAQQAGIAEADQRSREPFFAALAGFVLIGTLTCVLDQNYSGLDRLLAQVQRVADATSAEEVIAVLGDPAKRSPENPTHPLVDSLGLYFPDEAAVTNLELYWQDIRKPNSLAVLQVNSQRILALGKTLRLTHGGVTPPDGLPLSGLSGTPPNAELKLTEEGNLPERLPARNVAAIGTALFTDYLVAVEIAGMLLLVATIGAIAIAGRRAEGLR